MNKALGIIDAQRGFMPESEGTKLNYKGFGELAVPNGEYIVPAVNGLLAAFAARGLVTFTTQDWHPYSTAHFSDSPDFINTWPRHCVAETEGAKLHPSLNLPAGTKRFYKGFTPLEDATEDLSYSGFYAADKTRLTSLPESLIKENIDMLYLGGLALDYCVGKTALDFKQKLGIDVIVAIDATQGISDESSQTMLGEFARNGVRTAFSEDIIQELQRS